MLEEVRLFFKKRGVLEVDTPILSKTAPIDAHIDVMEVQTASCEIGYLHTSPEYAMKRLLAEGIGDIYQLSHVFRKEEIGSLHNPEFMMLEWYRVGKSLDDLIQETLDLISLFLGQIPYRLFSYREAFLHFVEIDYLTCSFTDLLSCARKTGDLLPLEAKDWNKDTLLQWICSFMIEPHFQELTVLHSYPASQAALAQTCFKKEEPIAERFEIYFQGVELANGFHELRDKKEQEQRLHKANHHREQMGKRQLPIDLNFLKALSLLPDCVGVAVGFDRLLLLQEKEKELKNILPFSWSEI